MRIAGIVRDSIVDGPGVRDVIFLQGCPHHCKGCHNPESWDTEGGTYRRNKDLLEELKDSSNNITISGGEPFLQIEDVIHFLQLLQVNSPVPKTVWIYTGYRFEELRYIWVTSLAKWGVEVIVDGRYEEDKKDPTLLFRGSSNQRLIDLPKSLKEQKVVLWEEKE